MQSKIHCTRLSYINIWKKEKSIFYSNAIARTNSVERSPSAYEIISYNEFSYIIFIQSRWTLLDPALDGWYLLDFLLELFQIFILLNNILFHSEIHIIQKTNESEIGPRQSTADEVTIVPLHLSVQTLQVIRHRFVGNLEFLLFSPFGVHINIWKAMAYLVQAGKGK